MTPAIVNTAWLRSDKAATIAALETRPFIKHVFLGVFPVWNAVNDQRVARYSVPYIW